MHSDLMDCLGTKKVTGFKKITDIGLSLYATFKRKNNARRQYSKAFAIGKRAAQGYNVYLTFGSDKTITVDAKDSYKRYAMAMKHYKEEVCSQDAFYDGYNRYR